MKSTVIAAATVLALGLTTPSFATESAVCPANYDPIFCPAPTAPAHAPQASRVDRPHVHALLTARAEHAKHAHAPAHVRHLAHYRPAPHAEPAAPVLRVATLEPHRVAPACEGPTISLLCPGYQLLGIAY